LTETEGEAHLGRVPTNQPEKGAGGWKIGGGNAANVPLICRDPWVYRPRTVESGCLSQRCLSSEPVKREPRRDTRVSLSPFAPLMYTMPTWRRYSLRCHQLNDAEALNAQLPRRGHFCDSSGIGAAQPHVLPPSLSIFPGCLRAWRPGGYCIVSDAAGRSRCRTGLPRSDSRAHVR